MQHEKATQKDLRAAKASRKATCQLEIFADKAMRAIKVAKVRAAK